MEYDARFSTLRVWRLGKSRELGQKAFHIFSDRAITAIAEANPQTLNELAKISGVGPKKLSDYGTEILDALARNK